MVNVKRFERKQKALLYKGSKCEKCGYNKCVGALHFHHKDPTIKSFTIGNCHSRSWEAIQKELDKCELICANCHAEEHARLDRK